MTQASMVVLVLNSGSSSIKYRLIDMPSGQSLARGVVERVGTPRARLTHQCGHRPPVVIEEPIQTHRHGIDRLLGFLTAQDAGPLSSLDEVDAVGHRVVHGGEQHWESVLVTPAVLEALQSIADLAPLHTPPNLAGIRACQEDLPGRPHVCVFDNGFHHTLAPEVYTYALPYELCQRYRIRRYGFHGIAFRSAHDRASALLGTPTAELRVVTLMLGSGNTANACDRGRSVEVSTGFTPHEGLVQSTRAGDMDAAVIPFLMDKENLSTAQITDILNRRSGWLGISGIGQDLRDVIAAADAGNERARLALDVHAHRARKYVGAYAATMGGVDLLVFTGTVAEKSAAVRERICRGLQFMGLTLDPAANAALEGEGIISTGDSPAKIVVTGVDEELVIARDTQRVVERRW